MMSDSCPSPTSADDCITLADAGPFGPVPRDMTPRWLWVLVRATGEPADEVWVRYQAEHAPEGLDVRPAAPPKPGTIGVAVIRRVPKLAASDCAAVEMEPARRGYRPRRARCAPTDRNLVTAQEFADHVGCSAASVHELVKLGLPNIKAPGIGRRILKEQAIAWLVAGGSRKSRVALKLAKAAYQAKKADANGAHHGSR